MDQKSKAFPPLRRRSIPNQVKILKNFWEKFAKPEFIRIFAIPKRWVRITVSTQDSQSCNRGSIPLPTTKKEEFASANSFFYLCAPALSPRSPVMMHQHPFSHTSASHLSLSCAPAPTIDKCARCDFRLHTEHGRKTYIIDCQRIEKS